MKAAVITGSTPPHVPRSQLCRDVTAQRYGMLHQYGRQCHRHFGSPCRVNEGKLYIALGIAAGVRFGSKEDMTL